mmetsp:Transcript_21838/g.37147  ORF Transcript_21838/g.37147 Transcript_21838/m.37147 type:complete len:128 (+) Transcript_21838:443-826(+)
MWVGVLSQSSWLLFVLLLNSVIHAFMYTYFLIKTVYPHVHIAAAKHLTMCQILQFIVGMIGSSPPLVLGNSCESQSSRFGLLLIQLYAAGLIYLFVTFASKKYNNNNNNNSEQRGVGAIGGSIDRAG